MPALQPVLSPEAPETTTHLTVTAAVPARPDDKQTADSVAIHSEEDLIVRLCGMPVDLSAPLLRSALATLTPQALLALVATTGEAHHRLIATRPDLDWRVTKALLRTQNDTITTLLVSNPGIAFDADDEAVLARRAQANAQVRAAIIAHPALKLAKAQLRADADDGAGHGNLKLLALLRGGETASFVREMARRLKLEPAGLSQTLTSPSPVTLALTVCASGLDRAVFLHILSRWQAAQGGEPYMANGQRPLILSIFTLSPADARRRLAALIDATH